MNEMSDSNRLSSARPSHASNGRPNPGNMSKQIMLKQGLAAMSDESLRKHIRSSFLKTYCQEPRELQVESVILLARGHPTFLLAGTGYGKTRIAEQFRSLFKGNDRGIVMVLNPLDALGDNQVSLK